MKCDLDDQLRLKKKMLHRRLKRVLTQYFTPYAANSSGVLYYFPYFAPPSMGSKYFTVSTSRVKYLLRT
jgi:hypothetical protein